MGQVKHWTMGVGKRKLRRALRQMDKPDQQWRVRCEAGAWEKRLSHGGARTVSAWVTALKEDGTVQGQNHTITLWRSGKLTSCCGFAGPRCREVLGAWRATLHAASWDRKKEAAALPKKMREAALLLGATRPKGLKDRSEPTRSEALWNQPYNLGRWARARGLFGRGPLSKRLFIEVVRHGMYRMPVMFSDLFTRCGGTVVRADWSNGVCLVDPLGSGGSAGWVWADIVPDGEGSHIIVVRKLPPAGGAALKF